MKKLMMVAMVAAAACGCVSYNKNTGDDANLKQWIVKDVVREKVSVGNKTVAAENNLNCLFGFICWGGYDVTADQSDEFLPLADSKAKNGAYAKACDDAQCDQLAAARYKLTTKDYFVFKQVKAEVTGYPVKVSGVEIIENKALNANCTKVDMR